MCPLRVFHLHQRLRAGVENQHAVAREEGGAGWESTPSDSQAISSLFSAPVIRREYSALLRSPLRHARNWLVFIVEKHPYSRTAHTGAFGPTTSSQYLNQRQRQHCARHHIMVQRCNPAMPWWCALAAVAPNNAPHRPRSVHIMALMSKLDAGFACKARSLRYRYISGALRPPDLIILCQRSINVSCFYARSLTALSLI